ncbi:DUF3515 family protein [Microbacterium sp.]|uniref:DUF3515 family protein n=1 Tax=Microbacterium sp. TaxID=51671 RepID=UPI0039E2415A
MSRPRSPRLAAVALLPVGLLGIAGCSQAVAMTPASGSNDPACAEVMVRLPATLDGQDRRWTDAQATAAWGAPATVLMTCGLDAPGPSDLPCDTAGGVDWLIDDTDAPNYRVTTFGRTPAVQVYLNADEVSSRTVLDALGVAVQQLPEDGHSCSERPTS